MTFKKIVSICLLFCIVATLAVAMSGCDDLGAFENTTEYYASFGDVVLINATTKEEKEYSVDKYFYSEDSRDNFLTGYDGIYKGVPHSEYVYMAIPLRSNIDVDTIALYLHSKTDVTVYASVYVTDKIPKSWRQLSDGDSSDESEGSAEGETSGKEYDDPDLKTRIGDVTVNLNEEKWNFFMLDHFVINGEAKKSIQINEDQYILLQFRNNSGVRVFNEEKQCYVDPVTALEIPKAEFTMTNLLIRALEVKEGNETQGGN